MRNEYEKRIDAVLDKINSTGIESLTKSEIELLDAHRHGREKEAFSRLVSEERETTFADDDGIFKFTLESTTKLGDTTTHKGVLECPAYRLRNETIPGRLTGRITVTANGEARPDFSHESGLDIWDFCGGLEYELDTFIDYVASVLGARK